MLYTLVGVRLGGQRPTSLGISLWKLNDPLKGLNLAFTGDEGGRGGADFLPAQHLACKPLWVILAYFLILDRSS